MAVTCTPADLLDTYPCLACLSESQLKAILVIALADNAGETVAEVLENSACYSCLSKKQMLQAVVAILGDTYLTRDTTVEQLRARIKCLLCAPPDKVDAALVYLLCDYFTAVQ